MKLRLYDYLELKYQSQDEDYRYYNTFNEFIEYYLSAMYIANENLYETVFEDEATYHYRNYEVDHKSRRIDILFMDEGQEEEW